MALKYVVKKTTFGFDKEKAEKYVARPFNVVTVDFKMLCDQVTKVGFVPRGTVKSVLDGLIDSLITYMEIGASVSLGEFGTFLFQIYHNVSRILHYFIQNSAGMNQFLGM